MAGQGCCLYMMPHYTRKFYNKPCFIVFVADISFYGWYVSFNWGSYSILG